MLAVAGVVERTMRSSAQRILRSAALLMTLTLLAKTTGLVRDMVVAWQFGTSPAMDAFLVASTLASLIVVWFRTPIRLFFVPLFSEELSKRGEAAAWKNASVPMNTTVISLLAAAGIGWLLSPYLIHVVAPGFTEQTKALSLDLTRIMMSTVVFLGLAWLFSAIFNSYQRFGRPGMTHSVDDLVAIPAVILLTPVMGIYGLVTATVMGAAARALVQVPILWKNRAYYTPTVDFKNPAVRRMLWMSFPLFVGIGGGQLATVFDRIFASLLPAGSLSALSYGHRLTYAFFELFVTSLTTVLFPFFSRIAGVEAYEDLGRKLFKSLKTVFWIVLPTSVGLLVLHEPLVRLVYQRGAFGDESVRLTAQAVFFYAIGLSAYSVANVLNFGFYSLKDTKTPVVLGLVRIGIKILLSFALVGSMAHSGLALAESLSFVIKVALLLWFLPRELRQPEYHQALRSFGVTAVIGLAMGAVVFLLLPVFAGLAEAGSLVATSMSVGGSAAIGAATYLIFSFILQRAEVNELYRFVRNGFARR
jgi:putative peptidoglycan lipid II flippase